MEAEKPYLNPNLTIQELAKKLKMSRNLLSQVVNERFNQNFSDFLNAYRIYDFIEKAQDESYKHFTFLALSQEVGFNSKSAFNRAFKKVTGTTPTEFFK